MSPTATLAAGDPARSDRRILWSTAFVRSATTSLIGVLLGVHLARAGLDAEVIGEVVTAGLVGGALASAIVTFGSDRLGRRRSLVALALLNAAGVAALASTTSPRALVVAAFLGMVNGMGRDRGAALVVEQAALPSVSTPEERTGVIARYTMTQDLGHAFGSLLAAAPGLAAHAASRAAPGAHRALLFACAVASLACVPLYRRLGSGVELASVRSGPSLSPESRAVLARVCALFALDSIAGGFLTTTMLSYFFFERFGASEVVIAALFFGARVANAASHLGAAWLARRIGLVNTMVFTHIPSSLLLVTVAFAPTLPVAAALFLLREGLVEMDVPTRQSYVLAVVAPSERTFASGVTNLVRLAGWAVAPWFAGRLMHRDSLLIPLVIGALMKVSYDLLLYAAFRGLPPPEERAPPAG